MIIALLSAAAVPVLAQSPPTLRIVTETPGLPSELFYGNIKVKPVRLRPGTNQVITIDDIDFFVQQQYIDFLGRMPDSTGFANWIATLNGCPNGGFGENLNPSCDRVHAAASRAAESFCGQRGGHRGPPPYRIASYTTLNSKG